MSLLEVEDLEAAYGSVKVLHGLSFTVEEGQVATILGPNGAGKTTTLRALTNMVRPYGRVTFDGQSIAGKATESIVKLGVAHVPEGRGSFPPLTVEDNLRLGAYTRKNGKELKADIERCYEYFPRLRERRNQQAGSLSGGEQQMLAVSRGLMLRPRLLLLDEPSLGLAPLIVREVFQNLCSISAEEGTTMLIVEQNANLVLEFADFAYVLESGRIALSGDADHIRKDEGMRRSYLGY